MNSKRAKIDWDDVRQRLEQSQRALEKSLNVDESRLKTVYAQRAAELAARRNQAAPSHLLPALVFSLGKEQYALELSYVLQVYPFAKYTQVPESPPQMLGVTNLRGEIRSVMDLGKMLELPASDNVVRGYVLLLRRDNSDVAVRVDQIETVRQIAIQDLAVTAGDDVELSARYVKGVTADHIIVLNTEAILDHPIFRNGTAN
jgi:purine-binding chemotaxis protein CheW